MRPFLTFILLLTLQLTLGQTFVYPTIKQKGVTLRDFVPPGWTILDSAFGDLNKDYLVDYAIVLQHSDSVTIAENDDTVRTQPRILLILFKIPSNDSLILIEQSNSFILNHDNPNMDDPYRSIKIANRTLQIEFYLFYNSGSWTVNNSIYRFRYENNEFILIGAEYSSFQRSTHDLEEYSYNFLTKKRSLKTENGDTGKQSTRWKTYNIINLKTLRTFPKPFTWAIEKDVYL